MTIDKLSPTFNFSAESGEDAVDSTASLEAHLVAVRERIRECKDKDISYAKLKLDEAEILNELDRGGEAWMAARPQFDYFAAQQHWQLAAETCDVLSQTNSAQSLIALANGVWLAVTFPIDPQATLSLLQAIVDETPDDSDGAAVAAATAKYVVDLRANDESHNDLSFFAMQLMGTVARRHSGIEQQQDFDQWIKRLELDQPDKFLIRLRNVIDVMAEDDWWVDRDALRTTLTDQ